MEHTYTALSLFDIALGGSGSHTARWFRFTLKIWPILYYRVKTGSSSRRLYGPEYVGMWKFRTALQLWRERQHDKILGTYGTNIIQFAGITSKTLLIVLVGTTSMS